jgi:hypothetical protein
MPRRRVALHADNRKSTTTTPERRMSAPTDFYLKQLQPLVGGTIAALARTGASDDPMDDELYGFVVKCRDGKERTLILLCDDEGNGPGSFMFADE